MMEHNNATPTSIILENATTMLEMNDSIGMMTKNNPSGPIMNDSMMTTPQAAILLLPHVIWTPPLLTLRWRNSSDLPTHRILH